MKLIGKNVAWASEPSQVLDFLQTGWDLGMATLGKHEPQGLIYLSRLLPHMVRLISFHTLTCVTDPFSFTQSLTLTFSCWVRLSVTCTLSVIFLHHSIMLCPSHVFSLTLSLLECISDTLPHTPSVMVSASSITHCPFKFLSQSHIHSVTLTQKHSPVTVVNSLWNSFYHTLSFLHTSVTLLSHILFVIVIIIFLCRSHNSDPT